jgi:hypothetical protein
MAFINQRRQGLEGEQVADLKQLLHKASSRGDFASEASYKVQIEQIQDACPHPDVKHRTHKLMVGIARFKKGDTLTWCKRCGKFLFRNGQSVEGDLPLSVWERLLQDEPF